MHTDLMFGDYSAGAHVLHLQCMCLLQVAGASARGHDEITEGRNGAVGKLEKGSHAG